MRADKGALASFVRPADAARAIRALREGGIEDVRVAMPAHYPEVVAAVGRPRSALGWVTFSGALAGLACGAALTIGTSLAWPISTGGKPIVSLPPFVIITFELTVLIGALTNLAALAWNAFRDERRRPFPRDRRFTLDQVGVFAVGDAPDTAERILREAGAQEVRRVD
jgi:Protein of unknown function (DUF3341)